MSCRVAQRRSAQGSVWSSTITDREALAARQAHFLTPLISVIHFKPCGVSVCPISEHQRRVSG